MPPVAPNASRSEMTPVKVPFEVASGRGLSTLKPSLKSGPVVGGRDRLADRAERGEARLPVGVEEHRGRAVGVVGKDAQPGRLRVADGDRPPDPGQVHLGAVVALELAAGPVDREALDVGAGSRQVSSATAAASAATGVGEGHGLGHGLAARAAAAQLARGDDVVVALGLERLEELQGDVCGTLELAGDDAAGERELAERELDLDPVERLLALRADADVGGALELVDLRARDLDLRRQLARAASRSLRPRGDDENACKCGENDCEANPHPTRVPAGVQAF